KNSLSAMRFIGQFIVPNPETASSEQITRALQQVYEIVACAESGVLQKKLLIEFSVFGKDFDAYLTRQSGSRFAGKSAPTAPAALGSANPDAHTKGMES